MSNLYICTGRVRSGSSSRVQKEGRVFRFLLNDFIESDSFLVSGRAFQKMVAEYRNSLCMATPLGLHIFGPGNSKERPSCRTEGTRRVVRLDKIRDI